MISLDAQHRYSLAGRSVPGVTETLRYCIGNPGLGQWYLDRGKAVHLAVQLAIQNRLDWSTVSEIIKPRVDGILQFIQDAKLTPVHTELILGSRHYQFGGTLDFVGNDANGRTVIADWKGTVDEAAKVQLAAYRLLYESNHKEKVHMGAAVQCLDSGKYKAHWQNRRDLTLAGNVFLAMLTVYSWKKANNLIPSNDTTEPTESD